MGVGVQYCPVRGGSNARMKLRCVRGGHRDLHTSGESSGLRRAPHRRHGICTFSRASTMSAGASFELVFFITQALIGGKVAGWVVLGVRG